MKKLTALLGLTAMLSAADMKALADHIAGLK
jgi:hypothetical protein